MRLRDLNRLPLSLATVALAIVGLVAVESFGRRLVARFVLPTGEAQWIWASVESSEPRPVAVYAVKDFDLPRAPLTAEILTLTDEESVVFLNDNPVGASRYRNGEPVRAYDVASMLKAGPNRLLAELRSSRGVGAFLLRLSAVDAEGAHSVVTDTTWRIYRRPHPSLFAEDPSLPEGEAPRVWGPPPAGRWVLSRRVLETPSIDELTTAPRPEAAHRFRLPDGDGVWRPLGRLDRFSPALGSWVTFDWGREVVGFLALRFPPDPSGDQAPLGLLFTGSEPPLASGARPDGYLVAMPGQRVWLDARPRRFRYLTFVGLCELSGAEAYLVDPERAAGMLAEDSSESGAFGLRATELKTPLENEVWSQLHRLTGVPVRETH